VHHARVPLQGPYNWSIDELPQVVCVEPFTPAAKHSTSAQLLGRTFSRHGEQLVCWISIMTA